VRRVKGNDRRPKLITEPGKRRKHAADEFDRSLEQLGVLAHREEAVVDWVGTGRALTQTPNASG
jgi:hypothetical protein